MGHELNAALAAEKARQPVAFEVPPELFHRGELATRADEANVFLEPSFHRQGVRSIEEVRAAGQKCRVVGETVNCADYPSLTLWPRSALIAPMLQWQARPGR